MEDKERYCQAVKKDNERAPKVKKLLKNYDWHLTFQVNY